MWENCSCLSFFLKCYTAKWKCRTVSVNKTWSRNYHIIVSQVEVPALPNHLTNLLLSSQVFMGTCGWLESWSICWSLPSTQIGKPLWRFSPFTKEKCHPVNEFRQVHYPVLGWTLKLVGGGHDLGGALVLFSHNAATGVYFIIELISWLLQQHQGYHFKALLSCLICKKK